MHIRFFFLRYTWLLPKKGKTMLTRAKKLILKLVSPGSLLNNDEPSRYSFYLQVTKPLIDEAKRGLVNKLVKNKLREIETEMLLLEESPMLVSSPKYQSLYFELQKSYAAKKTTRKTELKSSKLELIEQVKNGFDLQ